MIGKYFDGIAALAAALSAHQGGWDEILSVAGPILLILMVVVIASARLGKAPAGGTSDSSESTEAETAENGMGMAEAGADGVDDAEGELPSETMASDESSSTTQSSN